MLRCNQGALRSTPRCDRLTKEANIFFSLFVSERHGVGSGHHVDRLT